MFLGIAEPKLKGVNAKKSSKYYWIRKHLEHFRLQSPQKYTSNITHWETGAKRKKLWLPINFTEDRLITTVTGKTEKQMALKDNVHK